MLILAVDPSLGSTGLALGTGEQLAAVSTVGTEPGEDLWARLEPFAEHVLAWGEQLGAPAVVAVEEPPPTARDDVQHGGQAELGWKLGLLAGAVLAGARRRWPRCRAVLVPVGAWRALLPPEAPGGPTARRAPALPSTLPLAPGGGWMLDGEPVRTLEELLRRVELRDRPQPKLSDADARRDRWKERAVAEALRRWPGILGPARDAARSRARTSPPDHRLVGISDMAEAALLQLYVSTAPIAGLSATPRG